jgi:hypothetical protein
MARFFDMNLSDYKDFAVNVLFDQMALAPCFHKDLSKLVAEEDRCLAPTRMSLVWSMSLWEHLISLESLTILQKQSHALI